MKKIAFLLISILVITGCNQKSSKNRYELASYDEEIIPITKKLPSPSSAPIKIETNRKIDKKKIIKDGRLGLIVNDLEKTKSRIDTLVVLHNGYYANESFSNSDYESTFSLKIRVPSTNFEKFTREVESGDGEVVFKEIDARDVTEEFIDLETRLKNKRNYLQRYNNLLKQAKSVKDVLEIEEKTRKIEEEIESAEGRLKYLSDLVAFSTLELTISKQKDFKFNPIKRGKFTERLKQSLSKGWVGFIDFLLFMIKIWPLWMMLAIFIPVWKKLRIKRKKKN